MSRNCIGIEIGNREVRAVSLSGRPGRFTVSRAERFSLPPDGGLAERLRPAEQWLREFLSDAPGATITVALPPGDSLGRILELPPVAGSTLEELTRYESENNIPFAKADTVSDFVALQTRADTTLVLVGGARKSAVGVVSDWIRAAGGKLRRATISVSGRLAVWNQEGTPANGKNFGALLDIDHGTAEIVLTDKGSLTMSRSLSLPSSSDANGEATVRAAAVEFRRVVQAFRAQRRGASLPQVTVTGPVGATSSAMQALQSTLQIPVTRLNPWAECQLSGRANLVPEAERGAFACSTGLAFQGAGRGLPLNLIPEQERPGLSPVVRRGILRASAAMVGVVTVISWLSFSSRSPWSTTSMYEQQYETVRGNLSRGDSNSQSVEDREMAAALEALSSEVRQDAILWLEVMKRLSQSLPDGVSLTELAMEKGQSVVMRGWAKNNGLVADSMNAVKSMPMFEDAQVNYSHYTTVADQPRNEFEIIATFPKVESAPGKAVRR